MGHDAEVIADDELIYRRIPVSQGWYDPESKSPPSPKAFRPHRNDKDGLSVTRAKFRTASKVAQNTRGRKFFVATLRVGGLREHGLDVVAEPVKGNPGHAIILGLRYDNRRQTEDLQLLLAEKLCLRIDGPFP